MWLLSIKWPQSPRVARGRWPCFRSTVTAIFGPSRYGQALSAVGTVQQLTQAIAPPAFLQLWKLSLCTAPTTLQHQGLQLWKLSLRTVPTTLQHQGGSVIGQVTHVNARVPFAVVGALSLCGTLVGCLLPRLESCRGRAQEDAEAGTRGGWWERQRAGGGSARAAGWGQRRRRRLALVRVNFE